MRMFTLFIYLCVTAQAAVESNDCLKINTTVFKKDSSVKEFDEKKLQKHIAVFDKIGASVNSFKKRSNKNVKASTIDTVSVSYRYDQTTYANLKNNNIDLIQIDINDIPVFIYFVTSLPSRHLTQEEQLYYNKNSKIAPSFCTISHEDAIARASALLSTILGESEKNKFDSVEVREVSATNKDFIVYFSIKVRNDIWDSRSAAISINANTGEFKSYRCDGIANVDYSYIPKITKNQALQMYIDECLKLRADVVTNLVVLNKYRKNGKSVWAWHIYGMRKDKIIRRAAAMFINSETGEVLYKYLD